MTNNLYITYYTNIMKQLLTILFFFAALVCHASVNITKVDGWFESGYVTWAPVNGATDYNVYVKNSTTSTWTKLDRELVRKYPTYYRADAVGLKSGSYKFKVVPVNGSGEMTAEATETSSFFATAHDRSGFAHVGMPNGIGAYKNDGTLKDNARVIYVYANNASSVTCPVKVSKSGDATEQTGLQGIINAYQKGLDTTPLDIRIIGTIKKDNVGTLLSGDEGLQVKGQKAYSEMPITIEGIGDDAAISGFGVLIRNCHSTEFRNFAIMLCMDDCLSLDTENSNIWIHNMDFFYGNAGGDADQAKGDGTVDVKAHSKNVTVSYNHFYDAGKCSLGGMSGEQTDAWHTYHHNWFDHSDSRHPRIRVQFFHVYNNYYDGVAKYGIGCTSGGSAFVENNYFRNCKYPMLISQQGTDAEGDGTFSGEPGGVIKACNNVLVNPQKIQYNTGEMTDGKWDAVLVEDRAAEITAVALSGGSSYNSEADKAARTTYIENKMDDPEDVVEIVTGALGAGRMNHGDIDWKFDNSAQDENYAVISALKSMEIAYVSTLVGFADGTKISNGGATETVVGGDGQGISQEVNNSYVPSWGTGTIVVDGEITQGGGSTVTVGDPILGSDADYFWFNEANAEKVNALIKNGTITGGTFTPTQTIASSTGDSYSDYTGSIRLAQNETLTFYNADGIGKIDLYVSGNGSMKWQLATSTDGVTFTNTGNAVEGKKGAHPTVVAIPGEGVQYVRLTNLASGKRDVQGVKMYKPGEGGGSIATLTKSDLKAVKTNIDMNIGDALTLTKDDYTTSSTGAISITSGNVKIATVDAQGKITAIAEGTTVINIIQAADDTYKSGKASINLTVTDPRSDSALKLTSDASISMTEGKTSQIKVEGAVGTVTYKSSNEDVATVSATGLVKITGTGSATITITDAGSDKVKPGSVTVSVAGIQNMTGVEVCEFTGSKPSLSSVSVTGSYSTSKGSVTYGGTEYSTCVKMETATSIKLTPVDNCTVTLVFDATSTEKRIKVDGTTFTTDSKGMYSFAAEAGKTYEIKKGDSMNLFLIALEYGTGEDEPMKGDVNGDNEVNISDVTALVNIILGKSEKTKASDVNGDNEVNISDVTALVNIILGKTN